MAYAPINVDAYTNAYSGAFAGMAISGWIVNPTSSDYSNVATIAGAFAEAFDTLWNNASTLNWLQIQSIQSVCQEQFTGHAPGSLDNAIFSQASNWAVAAAACAGLVLEGDAFVSNQGITPSTPALGTGNVTGPGVSVVGDIPVFGNTTGDLLADSGVPIALVVFNPFTSTAGHLASFDDGSGNLIGDSGVVAADVVVNPAPVTSGHLPSFGDASGNLIGDSGIVAADVVVNPATSTAGHLSSFGDGTGNLIGDAGIVAADVVVNPATSTAGHLSSFGDGTGNLIGDAGIVAADVVVNPATSTAGHLSSFGDGTGNLIGDAGIVAADVVVNPASATSGNLASFGDGTGNLIGDAGQSVASLRQLTIVTEGTGARVLSANDAGTYIRCTAACVITVNNGVFAPGDTVLLRQVGVGAITFAGSATLTPPVTNTAVSGQQGATIGLVMHTANLGDLLGDLGDL